MAADDMAAAGQLERLIGVARREATRHAARPGAVGALLYGSLAPGLTLDLTPFSDVDLALVLEDAEMPAHFTEHRMAGGAKVDVLLFPRSQIAALAADPPTSIWQHGWTMSLLLTGLMRGGASAVLADPTGELTGVVETLTRRATYRDLVLPDCRWLLSGITEETVPKARQLLQEGRYLEAVSEAGTALWRVGGAVRGAGESKDLETAAGRLGVPELPSVMAELRDFSGPDPARVALYVEAVRRLWYHTRAALFVPVTERLRASGVADPDALELVGDYPLFWPGNRVTEWGRLIYEVDTSLRWAEWEMGRGHPVYANERLWAVGPKPTRDRVGRVREALAALGYDVADLAERTLADAEFQSLLAVATDAGILWPDRSAADAERAIALALRLHGLASAALAGEGNATPRSGSSG